MFDQSHQPLVYFGSLRAAAAPQYWHNERRPFMLQEILKLSKITLNCSTTAAKQYYNHTVSKQGHEADGNFLYQSCIHWFLATNWQTDKKQLWVMQHNCCLTSFLHQLMLSIWTWARSVRFIIYFSLLKTAVSWWEPRALLRHLRVWPELYSQVSYVAILQQNMNAPTPNTLKQCVLSTLIGFFNKVFCWQKKDNLWKQVASSWFSWLMQWYLHLCCVQYEVRCWRGGLPHWRSLRTINCIVYLGR